MARIAFENVVKRFGATTVMEELTLTIHDREFFTFVGPSGCGKSTALNLIAGLEDVSGGTIRFDDRAMNRVAPGDRDIAMVFQNYALYPHMNVFDNIAFPLKVRKTPRAEIETEVNRVADVLGLGALLGRRPRALSGGQRQRVALGRALVRRPKVFLMDEPLSNLDARLRLDMREELKRLHRAYRITTVYVTHDQEEAMVLSDRVAVLEAGRIRQLGAPEQVYDRPADLFVAGFIGSPPMNILEGDTARRLDGESGLGTEDGGVLGVRPADIEVYAEKPSGRSVETEVVIVEPTGSDVWVVGRWQDTELKGRGVPGDRFEVGRPAWFSFAPEKTHRFDARTGKRIAGTNAPASLRDC